MLRPKRRPARRDGGPEGGEGRSALNPPDAPQPTPPDAADAQPIAIFAEGIGVVGSTEHGDHVGMELLLGGGEKVSVLFPSRDFQKLMAALMAAGRAAHTQQVAWLGSAAAALTHQGAEPFVPTDWEFGRAQTRDGVDVVLVRLTKDQAPIIDAALTLDAADRFARELRETLDGEAPTRAVQ